mgnify:CR=1 FL=1
MKIYDSDAQATRLASNEGKNAVLRTKLTTDEQIGAFLARWPKSPLADRLRASLPREFCADIEQARDEAPVLLDWLAAHDDVDGDQLAGRVLRNGTAQCRGALGQR